MSGPRSSEVRDKVVALTEGVVFIRNRKDNELSNVSISYESEIPLYTGSHNAPVWRMGLTVKMLFRLASLPGILNPSVPVSFHSDPLHFKLGDMRVGTVGAYVIRIRITVQLRGIKTL